MSARAFPPSPPEGEGKGGGGESPRCFERRPRIGLYIILDRALLGDRDAAAVLRSLLAAGAGWFQYRDKRSSDKEVAAELARLGPLCRAAGARLLVNDRAHLAAAGRVDGVHLGASDMTVGEARRLLGPEKIVGRSAHAVDEALRAGKEGADYLGAGAVYFTATKGDAALLGVAGLSAICLGVGLPVVAIGGITRARVAELLAAGASGIAAASAVLSAADPGAAARGIIAEIERFDAGLGSGLKS